MTVFQTSGSNLPAKCCLHLPLECVWHSTSPELYPDLLLFLDRSSVPLHKRSPPLHPSAPSQLHLAPAVPAESPAGRLSEGARPSSSSWAWFFLWSRRRAMVSLLMSPSTVRPRGGPLRSASVRASRLRPSRRCCVHSSSTYCPKPSSFSHWATCLQLQALTLSSDSAMLLQKQTLLSNVGYDRDKNNWNYSGTHTHTDVLTDQRLLLTIL